MDGTTTINAKLDTLRTFRNVRDLGCARPRMLEYHGTACVYAAHVTHVTASLTVMVHCWVFIEVDEQRAAGRP